MSTYAVFGMSRHRALESARKTVPPMEKGEVIPEADWLARVDAEADKLMGGTRVVQLSEKFDSPHVANEFMAIAKRNGSRDLQIKAYVDTGERHPQTGRPKKKWIAIDPETLAPAR